MKNFARDDHAVSAGLVIGIAISLLLVGVFMPLGIEEIEGTNTSNWSASTITVFVLIPLAAVLAVVLAYFRQGGIGGAD